MNSLSTTLFACLLGLSVHLSHGQNVVSMSANEPSNSGRKLVCYYQPTSYFPASRVPASTCTHLIYAFGTITSAGPGIAPPSSGQASAWNTLTSLRQQNPQLKVMLSLQKDFNLVVGADKSLMQKFAANAVAYLRKYKFDGVDMDWEFPKSSQKAYFATFFQVMREAMEQEALETGGDPLLLSLALPNNQYVAATRYDLPAIASNVDFATAMTYDFHLFVKNIDTKTGYNSPLYTTPGDNKYYSASAMAQYYMSQGFTASKLLLGIPTYGRSWMLSSSANHGLHAPAVGKGDPGPYRHLRGVYSFPDACTALKQGATSVPDTKLGAAYLYSGNTWVAYDDVSTVTQKVQWAVQSGLGGVGVWSMALDDADNVCGMGSLPLLNTMKGALLGAGGAAHVFPDRDMQDKPTFRNRVHSTQH